MATKELEGKVTFKILNENTVESLKNENPDLLPSYSVDTTKDEDYNKEKINSVVTAAVVSGDSIPKIADSLEEKLTSINENTAIKTARTAMTSAQNEGTLKSFYNTQKNGFEIYKQWVCTLDDRTRPSHLKLMGERQELDDAFSNGCQYPGDPDGDPEEVYWCRCTMVSYMPAFATDDDWDPESESYEKWLTGEEIYTVQELEGESTDTTTTETTTTEQATETTTATESQTTAEQTTATTASAYDTAVGIIEKWKDGTATTDETEAALTQFAQTHTLTLDEKVALTDETVKAFAVNNTSAEEYMKVWTALDSTPEPGESTAGETATTTEQQATTEQAAEQTTEQATGTTAGAYDSAAGILKAWADNSATAEETKTALEQLAQSGIILTDKEKSELIDKAWDGFMNNSKASSQDFFDLQTIIESVSDGTQKEEQTTETASPADIVQALSNGELSVKEAEEKLDAWAAQGNTLTQDEKDNFSKELDLLYMDGAITVDQLVEMYDKVPVEKEETTGTITTANIEYFKSNTNEQNIAAIEQEQGKTAEEICTDYYGGQSGLTEYQFYLALAASGATHETLKELREVYAISETDYVNAIVELQKWTAPDTLQTTGDFDYKYYADQLDSAYGNQNYINMDIVEHLIDAGVDTGQLIDLYNENYITQKTLNACIYLENTPAGGTDTDVIYTLKQAVLNGYISETDYSELEGISNYTMSQFIAAVDTGSISVSDEAFAVMLIAQGMEKESDVNSFFKNGALDYDQKYLILDEQIKFTPQDPTYDATKEMDETIYKLAHYGIDESLDVEQYVGNTVDEIINTGYGFGVSSDKEVGFALAIAGASELELYAMLAKSEINEDIYNYAVDYLEKINSIESAATYTTGSVSLDADEKDGLISDMFSAYDNGVCSYTDIADMMTANGITDSDLEHAYKEGYIDFNAKDSLEDLLNYYAAGGYDDTAALEGYLKLYENGYLADTGELFNAVEIWAENSKYDVNAAMAEITPFLENYTLSAEDYYQLYKILEDNGPGSSNSSSSSGSWISDKALNYVELNYVKSDTYNQNGFCGDDVNGDYYECHGGRTTEKHFENNGMIDEVEAARDQDSYLETSMNHYTGSWYEDMNQYLQGKIADKTIWVNGELLSDECQSLQDFLTSATTAQDITVLRGVHCGQIAEMIGQYQDDNGLTNTIDYNDRTGKHLNYDMAKLENGVDGLRLTDHGFMSSTADLDSNSGIVVDKPVFLYIDIPKGTGTGAYVGQFSSFPSEHEYIIKANTTIEVYDCHYDSNVHGGRWIVHAKLIS